MKTDTEHKKTLMEINDLQENWEEQKAKLKLKFAKLTDNDFLLIDSKKEEILTKLQIKLGKTKEELTKIIEGL